MLTLRHRPHVSLATATMFPPASTVTVTLPCAAPAAGTPIAAGAAAPPATTDSIALGAAAVPGVVRPSEAGAGTPTGGVGLTIVPLPAGEDTPTETHTSMPATAVPTAAASPARGGAGTNSSTTSPAPLGATTASPLLSLAPLSAVTRCPRPCHRPAPCRPWDHGSTPQLRAPPRRYQPSTPSRRPHLPRRHRLWNRRSTSADSPRPFPPPSPPRRRPWPTTRRRPASMSAA